MKNAGDVVRKDLEHICGNLEDELPEMSGKNLLITGGAGFLGHYLVQSVLHWNRVSGGNRPIRLTVYDNFVRGVPGWLDRLKGDGNLVLVKHDVTDPLPGDMGHFEYIIHAACIASPTYYRRVPIQTMDANVNGLRYFLDYCRERKEMGRGVEGFLFYSTSEIYGDPTPENIPTPETYRGNVSCTGPRACYDESKRYGETLCVNFAGYHDIPVKVARPFNNYGPGLKISDRRVLPDFARDVLSGKDIVMLSDGGPTRTFCYVADAVVGYYKVLVKGRKGEAYNIGVEEPEISVAELADRVVRLSAELFGYKGKVVRKVSQDKDYLVDNPNRRCPVIAKARKEIGYNPSIGIDEGLRRSLLWYGDNRQAEDA
ncbi:MAG: NAD-dependent epimerase/dehydratase family protein [Deltaproteobacteria bacterium]|nr:NAD-dependent epimerase/dehydratase family protein [Deltaproteobacteria bacterium]